jgi:glycosyltransferase involved in cell wall biosynthesis
MSSETISVIIPVYNGERFLAEAIRSVLEQTLPPDEVIVVDDGSTDGSASIVAGLARTSSPPIRYVYQENQGPAAARNCALTTATGTMIAFMDADDLWLPDKTRQQAAVLAAHPAAGAAWGDAITFGGESVEEARAVGKVIPAHPMFLLQSMLFRRTVLDRVGAFDAQLRVGEDVDWLLRAIDQGVKFVLHREQAVYYRRHEANLTADRDAARRTFHSMFQRAIRRRRLTQPDRQDFPSPFIVL